MKAPQRRLRSENLRSEKNSTIRREDPRPLTRRRGQRAYSNLEKASNCRGRADTLKLQSKLSNSAVQQTGLRDYMASKVDCKCVGNEVGVAA